MVYLIIMPKLSKEDWLEKGFEILSEFNQDKLRIQYLCDRLGVTKGSFYHHFAGMQGFISELFLAWKQQNTLKFIELANRQGSPQEKLESLNEQVISVNQSVETAIRSWSFYHPIVQAAVKEVDSIRLEYLKQIYLSTGLGKNEAYQLAQLEYSTLVGLQFLFPQIQAEELKDLYTTYEKYRK